VLVLGVGLTGFDARLPSLLRHTTAQSAGILLLAGLAVVALEPAEQPISEAVAAVGSTAEP
jgi:hypothetical protein